MNCVLPLIRDLHTGVMRLISLSLKMGARASLVDMATDL